MKRRTLARYVMSGLVALMTLPFAAQAKDAPLSLDGLFRDNMVLPRHAAVVSGRAAPGEEVTVSFFNVSQLAAADDTGRFTVTLPPIPPGKTGKLAVSTGSGQRIELKDVISGDVFLCSGQSNMQMTVSRSLNSDTVIGNSTNPDIRMATVGVHPSPRPLTDFAAPVTWQKAAPDVVGSWSATCYFFAAALHKRVQVPIGLVHASLGGSNLTTWLTPEALLPDYAASQNLLSLYADSPDKAGIEFGRSFEQWWRDTGGPGTPWTTTAAELATWQTAPDVTQAFEKWGVRELSTYDGPLWYAATLTLTDAQAKALATKPATLELGQIDDIDQTWLNGQPIGFTSGGGTQRRYTVPAGSLNPGENVVIVNVIDLWGFGGMYGDIPRQLKMDDGKVVPLTGWRWSSVPVAQKFPPRAPWDAMGGVSILNNGMLAPMGPFAFVGAVWYQGESNVGKPYQGLQARLFRDWRNQFGPDLVFAVTQLANYGARASQPGESGWARLREDQRLAVLADGKATLATAIDIGDPTDIHPAGKPVLGERLARAMAIKLYGFKGSESGPQIRNVVRDGERLVLNFDGLEGDFIAYGATRPIGFELCTDTQCRYADADLAGQQIILPNAADAKRVRFCWADSPTCTLYDAKTGLPALPFEQMVAK